MDAKRGRGSRHGLFLCVVAGLGLALSACGGGAGSSAAGSSAQSSGPGQSSVTSDDSSSAQSASPPAAGDTTTGTTGTGATGASPPTATAGTVTINWTPPTENVDGSTLTNLSGYDIHYGTSSGNYTQTITVSNPGLATYVVSNLAPGTYYFAVGAVNSAGIESPLSAQVSVTVN